MTWFLIILNIAGGEPTFIEMPTEAACQAAVLSTETSGSRLAHTWCIPAGEWPVTPE